MEGKPITRYQRRAQRLQRFAAAREARLVARMAGLDYRSSGESGALVVHTHSLSWHRAKSPNITAPPPGKEWGRSGPIKIVQVHEVDPSNPGSHEQKGNQLAETATADTTE